MARAYTAAVSETGTHVLSVRARFGDCDPAGIVYFPKFFDFFHQAMETWFTAIGAPYDDVIVGRKIGFPAVHTEADFRAPTRFGEAIDIELRVEKVGTKSIRFGYRVLGEGETEPRVTGATVCVVMDLDPESPGFRQALAVPDDLRGQIDAFMIGPRTVG
jgi:4-hydroxybenzoyl-CoA thioesterase